MNASTPRAKAKILVDGGDPKKTARVKDLVGYVDGQTTNPTLISKNPEVRTRVSSGQKLSSREELDEYKKIVQSISPLVGDAGVSIEVFADLDTRRLHIRGGRCSPGFRMDISSTRARMKGYARRKFLCVSLCAST